MTSPEDVAPVKPPPSFSPGSPLVVSKTRFSEKTQPPQPLISPLPQSKPNSSLLRPPPASSGEPSRTTSPDGRISLSTPHLSRPRTISPFGHQSGGSEDIRSIIIRSFSPTIGVYASPDTDELVRQKGFKNGFRELIRPFGESVTGKIVIRDSVGSSRSWEDFGVRFIELGPRNQQSLDVDPEPVSPLVQIEQVLERHVQYADEPLDSWSRAGEPGSNSLPAPSPFYKTFLRLLLSSTPATPHETFAHPVACVIVISSHTPSPLESLRQLYAHTSQGDRKSPLWVYPEYLRYYVLVHDEDRDDITQSSALFDQMKRHFGLHCHLLRLRSNQCVLTDDDSTPFPTCEWLSSLEDISSMGEEETLIDVESLHSCLFESDVTAIKAFVRELVAQSVIPHMENRVALWNDQVASRRRGLSGRFMSMSRRWAGFGSSSRTSSSGYGTGGSNSNYDAIQGFYRSDAAEATLRKMADYAFMLRDWKLASSTYDLLRADFGNDKAWRYHAGAHEMCAVSMLLNPLATAKPKLEPIDQLLESACYSYLTRCSDAHNALRTLTLGLELLKTRGGLAAESAAKWAIRILDMGLVGTVGRILMSERVSACYASKVGLGGTGFGTRRRKAGMWAIIAADAWLKLGKPNLASICLEEADRLYDEVLEDGVFHLAEVQQFVDDLRLAIKVEYLEAQGIHAEDEVSATELGTEETSEKLDRRTHRKSLIAAVNPLEAGGTRLKVDDDNSRNDDFE